MGRKVRCHVAVDDPESFLADVKAWFTDNGYEIEREENTLVIFVTGSAAWTVIGTHQWSKTSRTVIVSIEDDESTPGNIEFLYDVSWLSIHYRPQGKVLGELESILEEIGYGDVEVTHEYESQI